MLILRRLKQVKIKTIIKKVEQYNIDFTIFVLWLLISLVVFLSKLSKAYKLTYNQPEVKMNSFLQNNKNGEKVNS